MSGATLAVALDPSVSEIGRKALETAFRNCEARLGRPATNLEVCEELGLSLRELYALLDRFRGVGLGCIDDLESAGDNIDPVSQIKYVPDPEDLQSSYVCPRTEFQIAIARAFETLPKNEKLVVSLYHNEELTMQEIAQIFGISETRVAQIHTTAMLRIRGKLQSFNEA